MSDSRFDVIGIGVSTVDLTMVVDELPGKEVVQRARNTILAGGGPVATAMVTLARLGSRAAMLDKVGDDWRGELIVSEFLKEGVSTEWIVTDPGRSSSIASILVREADGARAITFSPGDAEELLPSDLPEALIASARILHLNGRHYDAALASAKIARAHGVMVSFDGGAHRYSDQLRELVTLSDVCIVARQFASRFSGYDNIESSARLMLEEGPGVVVITGGAEGSWVFDRQGEAFHHAAFEMERVVDTTGAGDAYHGAFLHGMVNGYCLRECALLASAVGAMNTGGLGGRAGIPSFNETAGFLADRGMTLREPARSRG